MFDFGANWLSFSERALDQDKVDQARQGFRKLLGNTEIVGKSFLDIGFGQGLAAFIAAESGAQVRACDINQRCVDAANVTARLFPNVARSSINLTVGSILDKAMVEQLRLACPAGFDIVHSWGVLHHTGNMELALDHAASLVRPNGTLVLAIYNRHITSLPWLWIKWLYCKSPAFLQRLMVALFYPIIWVAKFLVTGKNPGIQERGMDFYYDVIDWVSGYPYEYASIDEMRESMKARGFRCDFVKPATVPTGCNEFVFRREA
jgi:2-polyprenyl-6-hydroxyphenyl methylase/3-demethylubiquinone-9 3-methyltransferase